MRVFASVWACAGVLLVTAGCDPATDRSYFSRGVGTELSTPDIANATELQNLYVEHICRQAGLAPGACGIENFDVTTWTLFVQAGMNDIDQRCDAYLTWLDGVRRSQAPILKQITDTGTASSLIMQATGVGAGPIAVVAAAFGLASNTFTNITSRLILEVNGSTVQAVVLGRQKTYREELFGAVGKPRTAIIASRPAAIFALRSYLRLCMPMTIETEINNTVTTFERGGAAALERKEPMIAARSVGTTVIRNVNAPLQRLAPLPATLGPTRIGPFEERMLRKDMERALSILGCAGTDLGPPGSPARKALAKFLADNGRPSSDRITNSVFFDLREIKAEGKQGSCSA
ncbi:MAG TPA: hypothetical protein VFK79_07135 [Xanthobacteraceae bacterium]|nr:hypothetical protein [Xanthobacteraceae bacterium]